MQRFQRSLIRIVKGPAGGFLASLGIAAILGGVALATPSQPIADLASHHPDVITAGPLGGTDPMPLGTGTSISTGGLQTDADPTGRGPSIGDPSAKGPRSGSAHGQGDPAGSHGAQAANGASGGANLGNQDVRVDPTPGGQHATGDHDQPSGQTGGSGSDERPTTGGSDPGSGDTGGRTGTTGQTGGGTQKHRGPSGGSGSGSSARGDGSNGSSGSSGAGGSGTSGTNGQRGSSH